MCCKVLDINDPEFTKPGGVWCQHIVHGKGCGIYATRPGVCQRYQCAWSISPHMADEWRPDRAKFVAHRSDEKTLHIINDPDFPDACRREPYYSQILSWSRRTGAPTDVIVHIYSRGETSIVFPEGEVNVGASNDRPIYSGYEMRNGKRVPYARYTGHPQVDEATSNQSA